MALSSFSLAIYTFRTRNTTHNTCTVFCGVCAALDYKPHPYCCNEIQYRHLPCYNRSFDHWSISRTLPPPPPPPLGGISSFQSVSYTPENTATLGKVKKMIVYRQRPPRIFALPAKLFRFLVPENVLYVLRSTPIQHLISVATDLEMRSPPVESYMYRIFRSIVRTFV